MQPVISPTPSTDILFGAAFYDEYVDADRLEIDLDLMQDAQFSVIRVGESVWSTWEPQDGVFALDWMQRILDGAFRRGIGVVLGTPTYAIPPWMMRKHPELAGELATGERKAWGSRQEVDYSSPVFRHYAERVIRAILERYASHPAVVGFQVDNEPGIILFHNEGTFEQFLVFLQNEYGTVENLNVQWGLTYWSHRITDWSELWVADGNSLPQYDLAWRRFQASVTTDFIGWQGEIVREYSSPAQFVTTCLSYSRPTLDDPKLMATMDVTAGNPYYRMQDGLDLAKDLPAMQPWTTARVDGLYRAADRMYSSRQERFLVTETNSGNIGASDQNYPPYPGQLRQSALALIARGARMVEYWHWHTIEYGTEMFWGGVLPHSRVPGRIYSEVAEIGATLKVLGPLLDGFEPHADAAILYSNESKWAFEFFPPFHTPERTPDRRSYAAVFDAYYRGLFDAGVQARIVHAEQFDRWDESDFVSRHPVLFVPALFVVSDETLDKLVRYAEAGGHLVVGMRTGYGDLEARARIAVAPARISDVAGMSYEEFSNLDTDLELKARGNFPLSEGAAATKWLDGVTVTTAQELVVYAHPQHGRFSALTTTAVGDGRISYLGTVPNATFAVDVVRWAVPKFAAAEWLEHAEGAIVVTSGTASAADSANDGNVWFLSNWSSTPGSVTVPANTPCHDPITGSTFSANDSISIAPFSSLVLFGTRTGH